jgi:hypothetical protein
MSGVPQAPQSKVNPHQVGPLTPQGNHILTLFDQPDCVAIPGVVRVLCGKSGVIRRHCAAHSRTSSTPPPSKEDGGTLERGTVTCSAPTGDDVVT